jgi:Zn-dependent peptidase ImmA (M78 family)
MSADHITPGPCNASKAAITAAAEKFADDVALQPGDPLEPLVERLGGRVRYKALEDADFDDGSIVVEGQGKFTISLPAYTGAARDRFTIAHELGHYFLHYPLCQGSMAAKRYGSDRVEWEANWFAAGLLMPSGQFQAAYTTYGGDIAKIASLFRVSMKAAQIRAKTLGLT